MWKSEIAWKCEDFDMRALKVCCFDSGNFWAEEGRSRERTSPFARSKCLGFMDLWHGGSIWLDSSLLFSLPFSPNVSLLFPSHRNIRELLRITFFHHHIPITFQISSHGGSVFMPDRFFRWHLCSIVSTSKGMFLPKKVKVGKMCFCFHSKTSVN